MRQILLVVLALAVAASPAAGGEEPEKKPGDEAKSRVFTNADLERLYGPPSGEDGAGVEYDRALFGEKSLSEILAGPPEELAAQRARAEAAHRRARERVDYLSRRAASIRNPFLARPELTEDDREAEAGLDSAARLARTLRQKAEAEAELARAGEVLVALGGTLPAEEPEARPEDKTRTLRVTAGAGNQ